LWCSASLLRFHKDLYVSARTRGIEWRDGAVEKLNFGTEKGERDPLGAD
jgi:hypothetical protein